MAAEVHGVRPSWWCGRGPIAVISAACMVLYVGYDLIRFATFHAPAYDLAFFDQLTSNLSTGRGWSTSFLPYDFRGQHWEPILLVWAQLYRIVQSPLWLLLISAIALALTPLAAWRLARRWLGDDTLAPAVVALATAVSPLLLRTAAFDYHSEALTPVLALAALEAASRQRWLAVAGACAALILLKEDAFLVVAGIGWLIWRVERRRLGLILAATATAGFVAVVGLYMPGFRAGRTSDLLSRYAYLQPDTGAPTPFGIMAGMLAHPDIWLSHLLSAASLQGLTVALLPLAALPLLSGAALLGAVPVLAVALLSADQYQQTLHYHYGAEVFALLLACALLGWRRLQGRDWAHRPGIRRATGGLALAAVVGGVLIAVNVSNMATNVSGLGRRSPVQSVLDRIPAGVAVAASTGLVPHLSERARITEFPDVRDARWVVIDSVALPSQESLDAGFRRAVTALPRAFHQVAASAGVILWERS